MGQYWDGKFGDKRLYQEPLDPPTEQYGAIVESKPVMLTRPIWIGLLVAILMFGPFAAVIIYLVATSK